MSLLKSIYQGVKWPAELHKAIKEKAEKENRSFSNVVITILRKHFKL